MAGIVLLTQYVNVDFAWCRFDWALRFRGRFSRFFPIGSAVVNSGRTLFSQVMDFIPWTSFDRLVAKYGGDVRVRKLRCTEQFRAMAFAQMTYCESLRDIEACLNAQPAKLYGMGFRNPVAKSTLADANELRDWRMWHDLAAVLIRRARKLYANDDVGLDLDSTVYALDSKSSRQNGRAGGAARLRALPAHCRNGHRRGSATAAVRPPSHPNTPTAGARNAWRCAGCRAQPPPPAPAADCRSCNSDNCATVARACVDCSSPPHLPGAHRAVSPLCRYRESTARLAAAAWCNRDAFAATPRRRLLRSCRGRAARHLRSPLPSFLTAAD